MVFTCIADFVCLRCPRYIADPLMQVDNLRKVSVACTSLCMWVRERGSPAVPTARCAGGQAVPLGGSEHCPRYAC